MKLLNKPNKLSVIVWIWLLLAIFRGKQNFWHVCNIDTKYTSVIKNAWRKTGYEWFPKEGGDIARIVAAVTNEGDENEEIPVLVETSTEEEDEAIVGNEEDEAIVGVLNSYLENNELFGNMMEGGDEEEEEELPHYIVN